MKVYKTFLCPDGDVDSYVAIDVTKWKKSSDIELKIADCDRNVKLYFKGKCKEKDKEYFLAKLNKLRIALDIVEKEINLK